jgi:hypothetical protein
MEWQWDWREKGDGNKTRQASDTVIRICAAIEWSWLQDQITKIGVVAVC